MVSSAPVTATVLLSPVPPPPGVGNAELPALANGFNLPAMTKDGTGGRPPSSLEPADAARLPEPLARFLALWHAKRGARRMPRRADFTHDDLGPWLGRLNLMVVEGDQARFAVFSSESTRVYGREMTGRLLSAFEPVQLAEAALADHRTFMAGGGVPMMRRVSGPFGNREMTWVRLAAALSDDGVTIDRYFVALHFD